MFCKKSAKLHTGYRYVKSFSDCLSVAPFIESYLRLYLSLCSCVYVCMLISYQTGWSVTVHADSRAMSELCLQAAVSAAKGAYKYRFFVTVCVCV